MTDEQKHVQKLNSMLGRPRRPHYVEIWREGYEAARRERAGSLMFGACLVFLAGALSALAVLYVIHAPRDNKSEHTSAYDTPIMQQDNTPYALCPEAAPYTHHR